MNEALDNKINALVCSIGIVVCIVSTIVLAGRPVPVHTETLDRKRDGCRVYLTRYSDGVVKTTVISCPQDGQ